MGDKIFGNDSSQIVGQMLFTILLNYTTYPHMNKLNRSTQFMATTP